MTANRTKPTFWFLVIDQNVSFLSPTLTPANDLTVLF
jgi:hypothetical protein